MFKNVFDVDYFFKNRDEYYAWLLKTKDGDEKDDNAVFAKNLYRIAKEKNVIPEKAIELHKKYLFNKNYIEPIKRIAKKTIFLH